MKHIYGQNISHHAALLDEAGTQFSLNTAHQIGMFDAALYEMVQVNPLAIRDAFATTGIFPPDVGKVTRKCLQLPAQSTASTSAAIGSGNSSGMTSSPNTPSPQEQDMVVRESIRQLSEQPSLSSYVPALRRAIHCIDATVQRENAVCQDLEVDPRTLLVKRVRQQNNPAAHRSALRCVVFCVWLLDRFNAFSTLKPYLKP